MVPSAIRKQLLGGSQQIQALRERLEEAAETDRPLVVEGERGTGRAHVARILHALSARKHNRFEQVDPDDHDAPPPVEDHLRRAAGGTLFVKEVAHVGRCQQRRLLSALSAPGGGAIHARKDASSDIHDVRVIAATCVDLERAVTDDLFDAELYRRLSGVRITLPPLRHRPDDIPLLIEHFSQAEARGLSLNRAAFASRALEKLSAYSWPGNVAELRNVVRRLLVRCRGGNVEVADVEAILPPVVERVPAEQLSFEEMVRGKIHALLQCMEGYPLEDLYDEIISRVERPLIELVLERTGNNQVKAAEMLGLNRNTLRKKLDQLQISLSDPKSAKRR
jgi:two-component system nitrogen regulation response regulator GlnG